MGGQRQLWLNLPSFCDSGIEQGNHRRSVPRRAHLRAMDPANPTGWFTHSTPIPTVLQDARIAVDPLLLVSLEPQEPSTRTSKSNEDEFRRKPMTTPMRRQYLAIKKQFPDTILFFRLGDFTRPLTTMPRSWRRSAMSLTSRSVGNDQRSAAGSACLYHSVEPHIAKLVNAATKLPSPSRTATSRRPVRSWSTGPSAAITAGTVVEPGHGRGTQQLPGRHCHRTPRPSTSGRRSRLRRHHHRRVRQTQISGPEALRICRKNWRLQPAEVLHQRSKGGKREGKPEDATATFGVSSFPLPSLSSVPAWQFELERTTHAVGPVRRRVAGGIWLRTSATGRARPVGLRSTEADTARAAPCRISPVCTYSTAEFATLDEATWRNLS